MCVRVPRRLTPKEGGVVSRETPAHMGLGLHAVEVHDWEKKCAWETGQNTTDRSYINHNYGNIKPRKNNQLYWHHKRIDGGLLKVLKTLPNTTVAIVHLGWWVNIIHKIQIIFLFRYSSEEMPELFDSISHLFYVNFGVWRVNIKTNTEQAEAEALTYYTVTNRK